MVKQFSERDSLIFSVAYSLWRAVGWPLRKRPSIDECKPLAEAVVDHLELANYRVEKNEQAPPHGTPG